MSPKVLRKVRENRWRLNRETRADVSGKRDAMRAVLLGPALLSLGGSHKATASTVGDASKVGQASKLPSKLPAGWQAVRDPRTGETYYWQPSTDITQWEFPSGGNENERTSYTTVFGRTVEEPDLRILWLKVVGLSFGLIMTNYALEYQDRFFPNLKRSRENVEYYMEMAKKYGLKEDEPLEEVGFRAMEIQRKERIAALAGSAVQTIDSIAEAATPQKKEETDNKEEPLPSSPLNEEESMRPSSPAKEREREINGSMESADNDKAETGAGRDEAEESSTPKK